MLSCNFLKIAIQSIMLWTRFSGPGAIFQKPILDILKMSKIKSNLLIIEAIQTIPTLIDFPI